MFFDVLWKSLDVDGCAGCRKELVVTRSEVSDSAEELFTDPLGVETYGSLTNLDTCHRSWSVVSG